MRSIALSCLAILAAGCFDSSAPLTSPERPTDGSVAFVQLSDTRPEAGSTVIVTARVRGAEGLSNVGSFAARLQFDSTALEYAGEANAAGGMRLLKPAAGEVRAAGASADGLSDGTLFAVVLKVRNPAGLESIRLEVSELTGTDFSAQLAKLSVDHRLFAR